MLNVGRRDVLHLARVQRTGQAADRRADHERPQLEPEGVDAHHFRGVLVLADGDPGAAHPAAFQVADEQQDGDDQHQAEPEPPGAVVGVARRVAAGEDAVGQLLALAEPRERDLG